MHTRKPPSGDRPLKTLERVLSKAGAGSRSEARRWIGAGRVKVNGSVVQTPDAWIDLEHDRVELDGAPLQREERIYLLMNKPRGVLTTYRDPEGRRTVFHLLPDRDRYLFPVGRLDLDTSGLLIMTNDAELAERLMNPDYHVPKTYCVTASKALDDEQLDRLRNGIELRDGATRPAIVERTGDATFDITITEGRNRQVRRMVESLDAKVDALERIAIGSITIGDLESGATRPLTRDEIESLTS